MIDSEVLEPPNIIAVGASAGGLEAIQDFLSHLPDLPNSAILIAQHLSPTHKSMLVQLLTRQTSWNVEEAIHGSKILPRMVYITPPDKEILVEGNTILLRKPTSSVGPKPSVDVLFRSLVSIHDRIIIGIILSGTGSDGASGVNSLKESGGVIIVQSPETAKYDGMPQSAISTGHVDLILSPDKMGEEIRFIFENNGKTRKVLEFQENFGAEGSSANTMSRVFTLLGKRSGTDFSNYKSATIARRLEKRLNALGIRSLEDYLRFIEKEPSEIDEMFKTILIGVTKFFRDEESFDALEKVLKSVVDQKSNRDSIRVWIPGCSTGEEAYSIAIILYKLLRERPEFINVQIFATDIDEKAITFARKGLYSSDSIEHLPPNVRDEFFIKKGNEYELLKVIRGMVLFSKHDIIKNPPFLKLDLISCRNLLIYFNSSLQQQIIPIFHYAINIGGHLFLGKSETIGQFSDLFSSVDGRNKIYQRKRGGSLNAVKFSALKPSKTIRNINSELNKFQSEPTHYTIPEMVKETFFNTFEHPYVVIDEEYNIQEVSGDVRLFLSLVQGSIQVNILKMVNPELQIELRSILTRVVRERTSIRSNIKKFDLFGSTHYVRITAKPLLYSNSSRELFIVIFEKLDIEEFLSKGIPPDEGSVINSRIQELEHELAATKEHLQTYIEEIETTNEELQSLNEEMQSTNEELQSSNEELETSNEELQSTNEEIQIAYAELKITHEELERKEREIIDNQANIQALLNNNQQSFVLVDTSYRIITFNNKAQDLFHSLRGLDLNIGNPIIDYLPKGQVESFLQEFNQATLGESIQAERSMESYSGDILHFVVNFTPVIGDGRVVRKVSIALMDVTDLRRAIYEVGFKDRLINTVFHAMSTGICITDEHGNYFDMNQKYCDIYGYRKDELLGQHFTIVVPEEGKEYMKDLHDKFIEGVSEPPGEYDVVGKSGLPIRVSVSANLLIQPDGRRFKVTSIIDVTEHNSNRKKVIQQNENFKEIAWIQSHKFRSPLSSLMGLVDLLDEKLLNQEESGDIIRKMKKLSAEMDEIVRDITTRLERGEDI